MVGAVAVVLRILDVILNLKNAHIVLAHHHPRNRIDIVHKGTDDTYTGNVVQIVLHGLQGQRIALAL